MRKPRLSRVTRATLDGLPGLGVDAFGGGVIDPPAAVAPQVIYVPAPTAGGAPLPGIGTPR